MRKWLLILGLLGLVLAVAAWRIPAGLVVGHAQSRLPGVDWSSSSGTVWQGSVQGVDWNGLQLGTLEWTFDGVEDAMARLSRWNIHSHSGQHDVQALVILSPTGEVRRVSQVRGTLPAAWVDITGKLPLLYLEGSLELDIDELELDRNLPVNGSGRVTWTGAAIHGGANERFGALRLNLSPRSTGRPDGMAFELVSMEPADVTFRGQGNILRSDYDIDLKLQVAPERDDLLQFMQQLGGETGPGLYRFTWQGTIR